MSTTSSGRSFKTTSCTSAPCATTVPTNRGTRRFSDPTASCSSMGSCNPGGRPRSPTTRPWFIRPWWPTGLPRACCCSTAVGEPPFARSSSTREWSVWSSSRKSRRSCACPGNSFLNTTTAEASGAYRTAARTTRGWKASTTTCTIGPKPNTTTRPKKYSMSSSWTIFTTSMISKRRKKTTSLACCCQPCCLTTEYSRHKSEMLRPSKRQHPTCRGASNSSTVCKEMALSGLLITRRDTSGSGIPGSL
mmetsp:Transcript_20822/g.49028  ORF Transcript_20822/g.49028 Transcript_20822/m.49028 type:complete len:248 (-) Transcript_20822:542-1285(-)